MQFRERKVRLGESLLAVARLEGAQSIVSAELPLQTKLALFGTRLVHPGAAMRLTALVQAKKRFFNARAKCPLHRALQGHPSQVQESGRDLHFQLHAAARDFPPLSIAESSL
jgi:hypothetical protein